MPLVVASLSAGLAAVFASMPPDGATAAMKIAIEYDKYCKTAMAPPGLPVFTGGEVKALEGILAGALASSNGSAAMVASAYSQGILSYWMMPVPFVGGPASGVVSSMPGAGAAIGPIMGALSNLGNTPETIGAQIAAALDAATRTVLVVYATPPPPAGPPPPATVI